MALGGVATGSMKASEAEMVQGNMMYSGCILMAVAWKNGHSHRRKLGSYKYQRSQKDLSATDVFQTT